MGGFIGNLVDFFKDICWSDDLFSLHQGLLIAPWTIALSNGYPVVGSWDFTALFFIWCSHWYVNRCVPSFESQKENIRQVTIVFQYIMVAKWCSEAVAIGDP